MPVQYLEVKVWNFFFFWQIGKSVKLKTAHQHVLLVASLKTLPSYAKFPIKVPNQRWKRCTLTAVRMLAVTVFLRLSLPSFARLLVLSFPLFIALISLPSFSGTGCRFHLESFLDRIVFSGCPSFVKSAGSPETCQTQYKKNKYNIPMPLNGTRTSDNHSKLQARKHILLLIKKQENTYLQTTKNKTSKINFSKTE